jgi:prolyl-tRNA editing enzyme YbaK/EbsC (Cys-tRNA(Pro) deacylase)
MNIPAFLEEQKCSFQRIPHDPTYSAQRLAGELHVPGYEVAKTVLLRANTKGDHQFIVAVLPAIKQIDFKHAAKILAANKVRLATEIEIAEHCPDCDFGVLPPFGSRDCRFKLSCRQRHLVRRQYLSRGNSHEIR